MSRPKSVDDWNLGILGVTPETYAFIRKRIKAELTKWVKLLIAQADGREGNVFRYDLVKEDFFYFTNCNDILSKDPESKSDETSLAIRRRKVRVMMQLMLKQIIGGPIFRKLKCSHCGCEDETIQATVNGHYRHCPKCKKVTLVGYEQTLIESANAIMEELKNE